MTKRALLCGVNEYQIPGADLRGCVNDVQDMKDVLLDLFGFDESDIKVLVDGDASKMAIEEALSELVANSTRGDVLYFHFSGHGSNVPDQDGDEVDHRDEILCPTDLDWDDPLRDDWMRDVLDRLAEGVSMTFVTDCCHSGTITRALGPPDERVKERYLPDPRDLRSVESGRPARGSTRSVRRTRELAASVDDVKDVDLPEVLITGCRADQTSADAFIDGDYHGALTHSLAAALRDTSGETTYRALHAEVLVRLAAGGFSQTPQLEGRVARFDQPFLSGIDIEVEEVADDDS